MSFALRIGLAVYSAGFILIAGLVTLVVLNVLDVASVELSAVPFVLALVLVLSGKLTMAQATKDSGTTLNG